MYPALQELQAAFKRHLMERDPAIIDHIASTADLSNEMRLAIYGNAYYARLIEALAQDYEALYYLLGDEEFPHLCRQYIDAHPSRFPSLRWFGQYMSRFLATHQPYTAHPYLHELAVFEWAFIEAFDAQDAPVATEADAARVPAENWPALRIRLHPSVRWFSYNWNILPLWKAAANEDSLPEIIQLDNTEYCAVWRRDLMTQFRTLEAGEAALMRGVNKNYNFAQLCESLAEMDSDPAQVPMRAAGILKTWLAQGMITALEID
ncbi:MAG: DNA-binding domain-containing protein [Gammaproteobacteria bacterium]|nr:DNA-binding domain-containing protein [Gammaproteobacteria bacterium]